MQWYDEEAIWDVSIKEMEGGLLKYNNNFVDKYFESIVKLLKVLKLAQIIFVAIYFKFPAVMRGMIFYDTLVRVLESCIPIQFSILHIYAPIVFDLFMNYCNDFLLNLFTMILTIIGMIIGHSYVMTKDANEAILGSLLPVISFSICYVFIALILGRNYLIIGHYQNLAKLHFKFAFNLKEGIVTV